MSKIYSQPNPESTHHESTLDRSGFDAQGSRSFAPPAFQLMADPVQREANLDEELEDMPIQGKDLALTPEEEEDNPVQAHGLGLEDEMEEEPAQMKRSPIQRMENLEEEEILQGHGLSIEESLKDGPMQLKSDPVQRDAAPTPPNNTGMPDQLLNGIQNLSGFDMSDVRVHYNSSKPAQLQAHAYAQGTDIHLGPGQEKHLPHEAWHVVQQKQGRVRPTMQLKGMGVNDDAGLEREADVMGEKAVMFSEKTIRLYRGNVAMTTPCPIVQREEIEFQGIRWWTTKNEMECEIKKLQVSPKTYMDRAHVALMAAVLSNKDDLLNLEKFAKTIDQLPKSTPGLDKLEEVKTMIQEVITKKDTPLASSSVTEKFQSTLNEVIEHTKSEMILDLVTYTIADYLATKSFFLTMTGNLGKEDIETQFKQFSAMNEKKQEISKDLSNFGWSPWTQGEKGNTVTACHDESGIRYFPHVSKVKNLSERVDKWRDNWNTKNNWRCSEITAFHMGPLAKAMYAITAFVDTNYLTYTEDPTFEPPYVKLTFVPACHDQCKPFLSKLGITDLALGVHSDSHYFVLDPGWIDQYGSNLIYELSEEKDSMNGDITKTTDR